MTTIEDQIQKLQNFDLVSCQHCGSKEDPWFDRSLNHNGDMVYRCSDCGKDVDEKAETESTVIIDYPIKQVIIMRTDLKIKHVGKFVAQGAHASIAFLTNAMREGREISPDAKAWVNGIFTKVALRIDGEEPLRELARQARENGLEVYEIVDRGLTEFNNVPTLTCIAIGPNKAESIDKITRHLKLL